MKIFSYLIGLKQKLFSDIKHIPESLNKRYFPSLDGLRGLAIMSVIASHFGRNESWLTYVDGAIGVHIFFILSGFLITTLLLKEKIVTGNISLRNFYIRRFLRIIPVAYLYLLVLIVLNYLFGLNIPALSFLMSFSFFRNIPLTNDWYTGHFWTLASEEQFYIITPILLSLWPNKYIKLSIILLVIVPLVDYTGFHNIGIFYTNRTIHVITMTFIALTSRSALYIITGSLFSILLFKGIINIERFNKKYYLSFFLLIIAGIIHFPNHLINIPYVSAVIFAVLIGFVIVLNLSEDNMLTLILKNPILNRIGILSYSIYIWQQIFTVYQPWKGSFKYSQNIFVNAAALFIVSYCSYNYFEKPFLKLKKHFTMDNNISSGSKILTSSMQKETTPEIL
ncbi:MAG TPA: acyltransferase [Mucilaginibacter sp.]|jgi:peptidoglycan/LPS O-acetylase OafA/YrhL